MIDLRAEGDVRVLHMTNDENRFNATSIADLHAALDELDAIDGPRALVTVGAGKFFSNGLDLDWLLGAAGEDGADNSGFLDDVNRVFGRILCNDAPTAAAINGHAFAGGAMLAAAHDFRVMRTDRGFWCVPEVDLGLPLTEGMTAVLQARVPADALHEAVVTGKRWGAEEMAARRIVEATADGEDGVLDAAVAWAASQAHHAGPVLGTMKRGLYPQAASVLLGDPDA